VEDQYSTEKIKNLYANPGENSLFTCLCSQGPHKTIVPFFLSSNSIICANHSVLGVQYLHYREHTHFYNRENIYSAQKSSVKSFIPYTIEVAQ